MYGVYIDITNRTYDHLAKIHQELTISPKAYNQEILLHTCHRVEWYGYGDPPQNINWSGAGIVHGKAAIRSRIATIASGAMSLVPGDNLVYRQVSNAVEIVEPSNNLSELGSQALAIALSARTLFDLTPIVDYADLPQVVAAQKASTRTIDLLIVGGGMLAREILKRSIYTYKNITLISRSTKKLSNTIKPLSLPNVRVLTPDMALAGGLTNPTQMVIATTSRRAHYRHQIASLARNAFIREILDLSAMPALDQRPDAYAHVNDLEICSLLQETNHPVKARALAAKAWIEVQQDEHP